MASYNPYNPIRGIGIGTSAVYVPAPSKYQWDLQDISDSDAGRTEDELMHKNRLGQKVKLELEWEAVNLEEGSTILTAFNPEYVVLEYLDAMAGTYLIKTFYIGDRSSVLYNAITGLWDTISFSAIEQ